MNEQMREAISALMDGEAQDLEVRRIVASVDDDNVRATWSSYHRTRSVMQSETIEFPQLDISSRVSAAIAAEMPLAKAAQSERGGGVWRSFGKLAVAASVAVVVVVGTTAYQAAQQSPGSAVEVAAIDANSASLPVVETAAPTVASSRVFPVVNDTQQLTGNVAVSANFAATQNNLFDEGVEKQAKLERYLLQHTQNAALNNGQGFISFARVARYDTEQ